MPDIRLQRGDGNLGLRGIETPDNAGDRAVSVAYLESHTTSNSAHPLNLWVATAAYEAGDQVLHNGGSNVNSIYVAARAVAAGRNPPSAQDNNNPDWYLVRSGITAVQGPDDTNQDPLVQNTTLHMMEGTGITITRQAETANFTFGLTGTHHNSDVEDFGPGWAYTFFDLENNVSRSGTVGGEVAPVSFFELFYIRDGVRFIFRNGANHFSTDPTNATNKFAFRTYGADPNETVPAGNSTDNHGEFFTDDPADPPQDYIIYCQRTTSPTNTPEATILAVDPPVATAAELGRIMGAPTDGDRNPFSADQFVTAFSLQEHHATPLDGVAPWATGDSTATVPANKLESLSESPPLADPDDPNSGFAPWADGDTFATINTDWLPANIAYEQIGTLTRTADDTTDESVVINETGEVTVTLHPQPKVVNDLDDVNLERPDPVPTEPVTQGIQWDPTGNEGAGEWINAAIPESSSLSQGTAEVPTRFRGDFVQLTDPTDSSINFVAQRYIVPATTFALSGGNVNRDLYGTTQNLTYTLTITDWDDPDNVPVVAVTPTGTGSATYAPNATDPNVGGTITATSFDNTTVNTFSFIVVVTGHVVPNNQRAISYIDNRRVAFLNADTVFDATGGSGYDYAMTTTGNLQVLAGDWAFRLNGTDLTGFSNSSGTIPRENANWVLGDNVFRAEGTSNRPPTVTPFITRTISVRRPYYWWQQDTTPNQPSQFDGIVTDTNGDIVEIAAGMDLMAPTAGDWYLAYPTQMGTFQYRTMRGGLITNAPPVSGTFIEPFLGLTDPLAPERQYTVLFFEGVSAGTTFDIETPQED